VPGGKPVEKVSQSWTVLSACFSEVQEQLEKAKGKEEHDNAARTLRRWLKKHSQ